MPMRNEILIVEDGEPEQKSQLASLREALIAGEASGIAPPGVFERIQARIYSRRSEKVANLDTPSGPA